MALLLLAAMVAALAPCAVARATDTLEYAVKATYLYKLGAFIEWPQSSFQSSNSPVNLCVSGADPFGDTLDKAVSGQHIGDRSILVRRVSRIARDSGCQILYVGNSSQQPVAEALDAVRGTAVLTVTDDGGSPAGIVQLVVKDNKVRFDIDDAAAATNGLAISSKLLRLASSVKPRLQP